MSIPTFFAVSDRMLNLVMILKRTFVLQAGSAYVPLDEGLPDDRASFMMEDCAAPILVTRGALETKLKVKQPLRVVSMDRGWHNKLKSNRKALEPVSPDCLAYIMYTSG